MCVGFRHGVAGIRGRHARRLQRARLCRAGRQLERILCRSQCRIRLGPSDWSGGVTTGSNSPAGGLFGATLGFNVQSGAFVFGAEGDIDGNWMRDSNSNGTGFCSSPGCGIQTSWYGTTRGRIGYAFDRALFYFTAGAAFGDVQMTTNGGTAHSDRVGWTAGAGLEYAFLGPWSAKIEYLYADLGSATAVLPSVAPTRGDFQYEYHSAWRELSILVTRRDRSNAQMQKPRAKSRGFLCTKIN